MEADFSEGEGGGTPLQDEPEYDYSLKEGGENDETNDRNEEDMESGGASQSDGEDDRMSTHSGPASPLSPRDGPSSPQSPMGSAPVSPGSPPGSPMYSDKGPESPRSPQSPPADEIGSPYQHNTEDSVDRNYDDPASPADETQQPASADSDVEMDQPVSPNESNQGSPINRSRSVSPAGSGLGPHSPAGGSTPVSPSQDRSRSPSPAGSQRSRSGSPARSRSRSPSPDEGQRSRSGSPSGSVGARSRSRSGSPARSRSGSPASVKSRSRSGSPARSQSGSPARSRSGSPARSRSGSRGSRSRSGSPRSVRSRSGSGSPARSRSRSGSPAGSRSRSGSPAGSRSRSGSPAGSRSRSGSPIRSRSGSPDSRGNRSRSGSPAGSNRSRSRSGSRASDRSRSRSRSGSRSRSVSPAGSGTPPYSPLGSRGSKSPPKSPAGSEKAGSDVEKEESDKEDLVADIFGSSDEDEEFEGFGEADVEATARKKEKKSAILSDDEGEGMATGETTTDSVLPELSDDENDAAVRRDGQDGEEFVSDFDVMMARKKEEMKKRRRKRKDFDLINDSDDLIADMINKMKVAAEEDRGLNMEKKPAIKKLKYLPVVVSQLKKADLHGAFLDCGILSAMTEWLAPLPDKSLPNLQIRENFLKILGEFPTLNPGALKTSGIGKAVMYIYKHPKEVKENKEKAGKLINDWSRPLFNLTSNYKSLSKEEREQRDYDQLPKRRRTSMEDGGMTPRKDLDKSLTGEQKALRPGDPGWIYRARVPLPSNKDYVIRPKWKTEEEMDEEDGSNRSVRKSGKKEPSRYEKHARKFAERKKNSKSMRAVTISIEGRNMAL